MDGISQSGPVDLEEARHLAEVLSRALGTRTRADAERQVAELRHLWPQYDWELDGQVIRVEAWSAEPAVT